MNSLVSTCLIRLLVSFAAGAREGAAYTFTNASIGVKFSDAGRGGGGSGGGNGRGSPGVDNGGGGGAGPFNLFGSLFGGQSKKPALWLKAKAKAEAEAKVSKA